MSELTASSNIGLLAGSVKRQQVMDVVRAATFIGALLVGWITLGPFTDLSEQALQDAPSGNEMPTYLAFGCLSLLAIGVVVRDNISGLKSLCSPAFLLFGGWIALTVVLSQDPSTSIRRFALTACVIGLTASMLLLPKSQDELMRWLSIGALGLLTACYLGVLLVPHLATHLITDPVEPHLAGDWRGTFGHKNLAAAVMAMLVFVGVSVARAGRWISGLTIVLFALVFLVFSGGKSSLMLCLAVLMLSSLAPLLPWTWLRAVALFTPLIVLNMLSIGTVISPALATIAGSLPLDTSFTGRTEIWTFGIEAAMQKLWTGYGFSAFWGSDAVRNLPGGMEWVATASHSHNGYLDTTLAMGLPGLLILIAVLVVIPFRNFQSARHGGNGGPLAMMLFRIWLFGIYLSSFESFFLDRSDPLWFTFLLAVFGLHYLARFRMRLS